MATEISSAPITEQITVSSGTAYGQQKIWQNPTGTTVGKLLIMQQGGTAVAFRIATVSGEGVGASGAGSKRYMEFTAGSSYSIDMICAKELGLYVSANTAASVNFSVQYWI